MLACQRRKFRIDLAASAGLEKANLQPKGARGFLQSVQLRSTWAVRVGQNGDANGSGHQLVQQREPLGGDFLVEEINACRIASGPGEARNEAEADRIFTDAEDDRNRRCRRLGRERCRLRGGRGDHGYPTADEVRHQGRQAVIAAFQPMVFDDHVLAFDLAGLAQPFAKRSQPARIGIGCPGIDEGDDRFCRLLRARRKRPRRRAAE